jgi:hypothetical protein
MHELERECNADTDTGGGQRTLSITIAAGKPAGQPHAHA